MNVFERAMRRIPTESDWCRGWYGRDPLGTTISYDLADRVDLIGAVLLAGGGKAEMQVLRCIVGQYDLAAWNDAPSRVHADVLDLLRAASRGRPAAAAEVRA